MWNGVVWCCSSLLALGACTLPTSFLLLCLFVCLFRFVYFVDDMVMLLLLLAPATALRKMCFVDCLFCSGLFCLVGGGVWETQK